MARRGRCNRVRCLNWVMGKGPIHAGVISALRRLLEGVGATTLAGEP